MNYKQFNYTNENYMIFKTEETYTRTASGKSWKQKPDGVEKEIVAPGHYTNYITSIPFFNNFGYGAYCRASFSYNEPGYLPTTVTSVSPGKETKKIARFWFIEKRILELNAGWREKEIIKNAKRFKVEYNNGHKLIYFYTNETGVTASGIFDTKTNSWRG